MVTVVWTLAVKWGYLSGGIGYVVVSIRRAVQEDKSVSTQCRWYFEVVESSFRVRGRPCFTRLRLRLDTGLRVEGTLVAVNTGIN
jgi:hypothetical protein